MIFSSCVPSKNTGRSVFAEYVTVTLPRLPALEPPPCVVDDVYVFPSTVMERVL